LKADGNREILESQQSKIVTVRQFRGMMSYWGLATFDQYSWSTYEWLGRQATGKFHSAEEFAYYIADELNKALSSMDFRDPKESGIGIHFSAYERVGDYWIPEMFLISNWEDPSYMSLRSSGVGCSRETFHTLSQQTPSPDHGNREFRMCVHNYLQENNYIGYNNGDPLIFNPAAGAIFEQFKAIARRGHLKDSASVRTYLNMTRRPVEIVTKTQLDFCEDKFRCVGGKSHDLAVTPEGIYESTSGDAD
jgi:hypothetical protein